SSSCEQGCVIMGPASKFFFTLAAYSVTGWLGSSSYSNLNEALPTCTMILFLLFAFTSTLRITMLLLPVTVRLYIPVGIFCGSGLPDAFIVRKNFCTGWP